MDNKKFVEAYIAQTESHSCLGPAYVKTLSNGLLEMYVPEFGECFVQKSYFALANHIIKQENKKKHPKWKTSEELHIWYDMNVVE